MPTVRDQRDLSGKFAEFTPAKLGAIIKQAERGLIEDWADLCDRMVVDATVKAAYETRLAAISGSRRVVEPGRTGDPERDKHAEDARAFVEQVIDDIEGFDGAIHDLLDGIGKGLSVAEIDWQYVAGTWVPASIDWVHTRRFKYSRTWEPLLVDTGETIDSNGIPLEPGRFMVHQPKPVAGYPMLTSVMRSVAWPYLFKRWCHQFWLNGAERFAWPFMHATVPRNAPDEVRQKALDAMEQLSSDHAAVLEDGTAFTLVESTMKDAGTWREFNVAMDGEITKAILGMTDITAPGRIGSYGAVESRKGATVDARIALDERQLATMVRRDLVTYLLQFNLHRWGGVMPAVPHVHWAVAHKRTEIATHILPSATHNEARESANLPKLEGPEGEKRIGETTDWSRVFEVVKAVVAAQLPRDSGVEMLIALGVDPIQAERIVGSAGKTAGAPAEPAPEAELDAA